MNWEERLKRQFVIPVLRNTDAEELYQTALALSAGGLKVLEITLMADSAYDVITRLSQEKELLIGAGTILSPQQAQRAFSAGASFFVSPGFDQESAAYAASMKIPFIPGVLTPSEVMKAQAFGCSLVKVFPVSSMGGVSYLNNLHGPFPQMKWMATGGISIEDIPAYLKSKTWCIGLGGNIAPANLVQSRDWQSLTDLARKVSAMIANERVHLKNE